MTGLDISRYDRLKLQAVAHQYIRRAVAKGSIAKISGLLCVDCGNPAQNYDHRDYREPLVVEPVCRSCNYRRPMALPLLKKFVEGIEKVKDVRYVQVMTRITPTQNTKLKRLAKKLHMTRSSYIDFLIGRAK